MTGLFLLLFNGLSCLRVIFCRNARIIILRLKICCQFIRIPIFFFCICGNTQFFKIVIEHFFQHMIADRIRTAINKLPLKARLRHQGGALRNLIHPFLQFHSLRHMIGTYHIEHTGLRLHHIGT